MDNERLKKQMDFILEMDKMKSIMRQTYLANGERKENDAEHSWHLALMCGILAEYSNEPIDVLKTMKMVLLHDAIEIDAGDTYAYEPDKKRAGAKGGRPDISDTPGRYGKRIPEPLGRI